MLYLLLLSTLSACKDKWPQEDKDMFLQSCMEDANTWAGSAENAKSVCNCRLEKMIQKFPDEGDALEHMDSLMKDPDIANCKDQILKK